jgi:flagella basal body P-ring formation protein FlgA
MSVAVLLILLGAAGAVWLSAQGQARVGVVALARPVHRGQVVTAADLATVQVNVDGGRVRVATPASAARDIVGRAALLDLPAGQLLSAELWRQRPRRRRTR